MCDGERGEERGVKGWGWGEEGEELREGGDLVDGAQRGCKLSFGVERSGPCFLKLQNF